MNDEFGRTAVLWTGGKDSCLALYRALDSGANLRVLVTFVPDGQVDFRAHPVSTMKQQAKVLELEHRLVPISPPYREAYVSALRELHVAFRLNSLVTGDIDFVDGFPNWITECSEGMDLSVVCPLWQMPRERLLGELIWRGIAADITWIREDALPKSWLGRRIDERFIEDVVALSAKAPLDICGENGEYHTMVVAFPGL